MLFHLTVIKPHSGLGPKQNKHIRRGGQARAELSEDFAGQALQAISADSVSRLLGNAHGEPAFAALLTHPHKKIKKVAGHLPPEPLDGLHVAVEFEALGSFKALGFTG